MRRGRSGLRRAGRWVTPTRGNPRDSATENRPPGLAQVRVKRWCKRPPAIRVTGSARQTPPGARSNSARSRAARPSARVDRTRPAATSVLDGWSPNGAPQGAREQNPAYRPAPPHQASDLRKRRYRGVQSADPNGASAKTPSGVATSRVASPVPSGEVVVIGTGPVRLDICTGRSRVPR
jgi:hypothetical protein